MSIHVVLPPGDANSLLALLKTPFELEENDWCELRRADGAQAIYGPCERPT